MADETEEIGVKLSLKDRAQFSSDSDKVSADIKGIGAAAAEADTSSRKMTDGVGEASKSLNVLGSLANFAKYYVGYQLVSSLGQAAESAVSFGLRSASSFEQAEIAFQTLLGSKEAGQQFTQMLQDFAATTPFNYADLIKTSQQLLAMGFTAQQVKPALTAIGDAAAGLSSGQDGVNHISLALGQMLTLGKIQGRDMLQLTEAGVNGWKILADASHKTIAQVQADASAGLIPAQQGVQVLLAGMEKQFGGLMNKQSQTLGGEWSNFVDRLQQRTVRALQPVTTWLEGQLPRATDLAGNAVDKLGIGISRVLNWLQAAGQNKEFRDALSDTGHIVGDLWSIFHSYLLPELGTFAAVALPVLVLGLRGLRTALDFVRQNADWLAPLFWAATTALLAYKAVTEGVLLPMKLMEGAQAAVNVAMDANPIGLVVAGIAALTVGLVYAYGHWTSFRDVVNDVANSLSTVFNWLAQVAQKIANLPGKVWGKVEDLAGDGSSLVSNYIPGLASGGTVTRGGMTWVGEKGPELLNLGAGSQVIPLDKAAPGAASGSSVVFQDGSIQVLAADFLNGDKMADTVVDKIKDQLARL